LGAVDAVPVELPLARFVRVGGREEEPSCVKGEVAALVVCDAVRRTLSRGERVELKGSSLYLDRCRRRWSTFGRVSFSGQ